MKGEMHERGKKRKSSARNTIVNIVCDTSRFMLVAYTEHYMDLYKLYTYEYKYIYYYEIMIFR